MAMVVGKCGLKTKPPGGFVDSPHFPPTIANQNARSEANPHGKQAGREKCGLGRGENPPVVVRLGRNIVVALDPVDDQVADFRAGAVNDRCVLIHRVAAAAIQPVIIDGDCTNCGRCIDVCSKDVFGFVPRLSGRGDVRVQLGE